MRDDSIPPRACSRACLVRPMIQEASTVVRYVALGDSYTIGTRSTTRRALPGSAGRRARRGRPPTLELVANLGVNGYTTRDLIRDELRPSTGSSPGSSTVLIGVNDVVQGVPADRYEANVVDDPRRAPGPAAGRSAS